MCISFKNRNQFLFHSKQEVSAKKDKPYCEHFSILKLEKVIHFHIHLLEVRLVVCR
jgi:hypothetical protein